MAERRRQQAETKEAARLEALERKRRAREQGECVDKSTLGSIDALVARAMAGQASGKSRKSNKEMHSKKQGQKKKEETGS